MAHQQRGPYSPGNSHQALPYPGNPAFRGQPQPQQRPAQPPIGGSGLRPMQLRHSPAHQPSFATGPSQSQAQARPRPNIPILQVTVPPPAHHYPQAQPPRSTGAPVHSPGSPYSSNDTLVGSGDSHEKKPWSPYASLNSPSIKNLQLAPPTEDVIAHPENDRLSPATPGLAGQKDFWKRFSTVVRANQEQEHMVEKVGGKGAHTGAGSEWLDKQKTKERNYKFWVAGVAVLIIAGIGGGLAYHFITREKPDPNAEASQPGQKDFGLGTLGDEPTSATSAVEVQATASQTLAAPSEVAAGATLRARSLLAAEAYTTLPAIVAPRSHGKRRQPLQHRSLAALD